jgi:transposase-like protein
LVAKFDVHAIQINKWKKQLLSGAPDVFKKGAQKAEDAEQAVSELHAKIGQLTMENDFLERGLTRIHGSRGRNDDVDGTAVDHSPVQSAGFTSHNVLPRTQTDL